MSPRRRSGSEPFALALVIWPKLVHMAARPSRAGASLSWTANRPKSLLPERFRAPLISTANGRVVVSFSYKSLLRETRDSVAARPAHLYLLTRLSIAIAPTCCDGALNCVLCTARGQPRVTSGQGPLRAARRR